MFNIVLTCTSMAMSLGGVLKWTFESCNLAHLATHTRVGSPNGRFPRNKVHNSRLGLTRMGDVQARNISSGENRFAVVHNWENVDAPRVYSVDLCSMWLKRLCCIDPKGEVKLWLQRRIAAPAPSSTEDHQDSSARLLHSPTHPPNVYCVDRLTSPYA